MHARFTEIKSQERNSALSHYLQITPIHSLLSAIHVWRLTWQLRPLTHYHRGPQAKTNELTLSLCLNYLNISQKIWTALHLKSLTLWPTKHIISVPFIHLCPAAFPQVLKVFLAVDWSVCKLLFLTSITRHDKLFQVDKTSWNVASWLCHVATLPIYDRPLPVQKFISTIS